MMESSSATIHSIEVLVRDPQASPTAARISKAQACASKQGACQ